MNLEKSLNKSGTRLDDRKLLEVRKFAENNCYISHQFVCADPKSHKNDMIKVFCYDQRPILKFVYSRVLNLNSPIFKLRSCPLQLLLKANCIEYDGNPISLVIKEINLYICRKIIDLVYWPVAINFNLDEQVIVVDPTENEGSEGMVAVFAGRDIFYVESRDVEVSLEQIHKCMYLYFTKNIKCDDLLDPRTLSSN